MKNLIICTIFLTIFNSTFAASNFEFTLESGAVWQHRNDAQITPETGTRINFDDFNHGPFFHYRAEAFYHFLPKHSLRLLFAPFSVTISGQTSSDLNFNNQVFSQSEDLSLSYRFNSYRLSYIYKFLDYSSFKLSGGISLKVRDAEIKVSQNGITSAYDNLGFVPLFYLATKINLSQRSYLNIDTDFAYAPQGRATDFAIKYR
jgi:hypothetical protein